MIFLRARALTALAKPQYACRSSHHRNHVRAYATVGAGSDASDLIKSTRNIGIIAHIDAGKTTTTERMLYYSGFTRRIGNVDDGSTVTDFLPAEQKRGITIQSAAITLHWPPLPESGDHGGGMKTIAKGAPNPDSHTINLIDTPGHADFTFEVVRSLRILDGAVCILDGVAGVEAQTEKVWHQARLYNIPRIIYVNKLDREGAAFGRTVREIAAKLHVYPAVCQLPWFEGGRGDFCGLVDVVNMRAMKWDGGDGKRITVMELDELGAVEPELAEQAVKARIALVELLSEYDDNMVDAFLSYNEKHMEVPAAEITASLRRMLLESHPVIPVLAGASFRNIGVQPVLDYITSLLPNPAEAPDPFFRAGANSGGLRQLVSEKLQLRLPPNRDGKKTPVKKAVTAHPSKIEACALAFKVVHDPKRGVLVYVRVYHGSLRRGVTLYNTNLQTPEKAPRLFRMYANDPVDIDSIEAGQIGVITGLKQARTGDTLVAYSGMNPTSGPPAPLNELQLRPIDVPPPVFFVSVLPDSLAEQKPTEEALKILLREDPSLQVRTDEESGQMLLSGMGELHMEIARDRLIQDMKAKCSVGKIEISFRECLGGSDVVEETALYEREIAGKTVRARCTAILEPLSHDEFVAKGSRRTAMNQDGNEIIIQLSKPSSSSSTSSDETLEASEDYEGGWGGSSGSNLSLDPDAVQTALHTGALGGLSRGPRLSAPMCGVRATIRFDPVHDSFGPATTAGALSQAARLAVQQAIRASAAHHPTGLMEPVMNVVITATDETFGSVMHDLTASRSAQILSLDEGSGSGGTGVGGSADPAVYQQAQETMTQQQQQQQAQSREEVARIDLKRVYAPPDPWDSGAVMGHEESAWRPGGNRPRVINARVPLREMVGYLKHLRSITKGRGTFVMSVDRFERMGGSTERKVLAELRGGF